MPSALKCRAKSKRRSASRSTESNFTMQEIFGPEGLIAQAHPEYEYRPGQVDMASAVMRAFEEHRHLIVEAGTGTGKTLAYLVPAVASALAGQGRVIISTG